MNILAALAADQNLNPAFRLAVAPQQYRATCGRKRVYLCANDARQYEAGWLQWPDEMPADVALSTPYSSGWWDAQDDADARQEERMDMARARADE